MCTLTETESSSPYTRAAFGLRAFLPFNLNHKVRFKLTDFGRTVEGGGGFTPRADGWCYAQLHHVMEVFGRHLLIGAAMPIEADIEFEVNHAD